MDKQDYYRFIHDLYEFNDENPAENAYYKKDIVKNLQSHETRSRGIRGIRDPIVDIYAFCMMPNHFHLLIKQKKEKGISTFMQKLGTGYTGYFNRKYDRVGSLFQGPFKATQAEQQGYFIYIPYYIHLNPLKIIEPKWKDGKFNDFDKAINFLESYRWSSYLDYIGKKNFPSLINKRFLSGFFEKPENHRQEMINWLKNISLEDTENLRDSVS